MKRLFTVLLLSATISVPVFGQSATEVVQRANDKLQGESSVANMTMEIVRPDWERSVSMKAWSLGQEYSLILITAPARDEGSAFLKRGNEIWNWLPDINRTIKMPPSMMSQSWMGSDFDNNDLVRESSIVVDYVHSFAGDSTINGYEAHKIIMTPREDAPIVWDNVVVFISKEEYLQLRSEFYDENGELVRLMESSEIREIGGRLLPARMEMYPMDEEGHKTVIIYDDIEFNVNLNERFFSLQNMKRVE